MSQPTVLIVPGLRDEIPGHWQTLLAKELPRVRCVPPMGRADLDCERRVQAIEAAAQAIDGPMVIVAHSGGTIMVAHWATRVCTRPVQGALLVTPPDFESPMPAGYPTIDELRAGGWLPVPREPLPFNAVVLASTNDPLARVPAVERLARDWAGDFVELGEVGHMNPASGFGPWPAAHYWIARLASNPFNGT